MHLQSAAKRFVILNLEIDHSQFQNDKVKDDAPIICCINAVTSVVEPFNCALLNLSLCDASIHDSS